MAWSCDRAAIISEFFKKSRTGASLGNLSAAIDADDLTLTLSSATASLDGGYWPIKIGSELILASQSGVTLVVSTGGRGYLGSTAAIHTEGATARAATLSDVFGAAIYTEQMPRTWNTTKPAMRFDLIGGEPNSLAPIYTPVVRCFCYSGNYSPYDCDVLYRVLSDALHETDLGPTEVTSGVVVGAIEEVEGQILWDEDIKPERPFSMATIAFELRGK